MVQSPTPPRAPIRRFTVADYHAMAEAGILLEDDRVELLAGEVVQMVPIGSRHNGVMNRLNRALVTRTQDRAVVQVQGSIRLDEHSEPQPEIALLRPREDFYADAHAGPLDVLLLIEVMQTSADYDRSVKIPLYAQAGIAEVWLIDLDAERVEVFQSPTERRYLTRAEHRAGEALTVPGLPDVQISLDDILRSRPAA